MGNCELQAPAQPVQFERVWRSVKLAVTPIGLKVSPDLQAYHSSIAINDTEYSFTNKGLISTPPFHSHIRARGPKTVIEKGHTDVSAVQMLTVLEPHFAAGSYDILRKNCNSFSDCALYCLLGVRLDDQYKAIDQLGTSADKLGCVRLLTMWDYKPNPRAEGFSLDNVLEELGRRRCLASQSSQSSQCSRMPMNFSLGQRVQVQSEPNSWLGARVMDIQNDGRVTVLYDGTQHHASVPPHIIAGAV